jgi:hypothetical protein
VAIGVEKGARSDEILGQDTTVTDVATYWMWFTRKFREPPSDPRTKREPKLGRSKASDGSDLGRNKWRRDDRLLRWRWTCVAPASD